MMRLEVRAWSHPRQSGPSMSQSWSDTTAALPGLGPIGSTVPAMDAGHLLPKDAVAQGVPKATVYRARAAFLERSKEKVFVVDGRVLADPAELVDLLASLHARAVRAEEALDQAIEARRNVEADLLMSRSELEQANARVAEFAPALSDIARPGHSVAQGQHSGSQPPTELTRST